MIPDYLYTLKKYAFSGASIKKLDLNEVYSIGEKCFNGASNLGELTMKKDVSTMGADAFTGTNITKLNFNIPAAEKLTNMPYTSSKIKTVTFGSNVTKIPDRAFEGSGISSVTLPDNLTWIGQYAFNACLGLHEISIPDGVYSIGDMAFANCNLLSVKLPENLELILPGAFGGNILLESIDIPAKVYQIGAVAFGDCIRLKTLKLNGVFKYFTANAFLNTDIQTLVYNIENAEELTIIPYDRSKLTSITIGPKTRVIAKNAFAGSQITTIEIPKNVTKICNDAFYGTNISRVDYAGTLAEWCKIDFGTRTSNPLCNSASGTSSKTSDLYVGGTKVENLVIPSGVTDLKNFTFFHSSIKTVDFGGVKTIGQETFSGNKNLTSVTLPACVSSIGGWAFAECSNLVEVTSLNTTPPTLGNNEVFKDTKSGLVAKVPLGSYLDYKNAENWNSQYSTVVPMSGTLALTDAAGYEIDKNVADCTLSYTRKVSTDNWMGVYLPFDVDVTKVGGTYATLESVSDGYLNWTTVSTGTIAACTPFIFKPASSGEITFTSSDGKLHSCKESHPATFGGYTLSGTLVKKTDMQGIYALANGMFRRGGSSSQPLSPYRIFLTVPGTSNAPLRIRINGEEVTAIDDIELDADFDNTRAYNLHGLPVADSYKGIVIINGKKIMRK